ncbi:MAG: serine/threonine protein kinase [Armatimonadetes bacterium]|nr:serine/threonine protein kinase [Armatimonadota bacterium]
MDAASNLSCADPEQLGSRYYLERPLGSGAMGQVFEAFDLSLSRKVAVKTLLPECKEEQWVQRFLQEARAAAQLEHPGIIPIHDLGYSADERPYLAMRLVQGETLGAVIQRLADGDEETHRQFSFSRRLQVIARVAEALQFAHDRGVLHRDVKPDNILLGTRDEVVLADWGLAGFSKPEELGPAADPESRATGLSADGQIVGTLGYVAPEQLTGESAGDAHLDVYSLGATMYQLFTLRTPHSQQGTLSDVVGRILTEEVPPADDFLHAHQGRVPRHIAMIIEKATARDPAQRYGSCLQIAAAIQDYLDGEAPAVCICTGTKSLLWRMLRLLDNHPHAFVVGGLLAVLIPVLELILILMLW